MCIDAFDKEWWWQGTEKFWVLKAGHVYMNRNCILLFVSVTNSFNITRILHKPIRRNFAEILTIKQLNGSKYPDRTKNKGFKNFKF